MFDLNPSRVEKAIALFGSGDVGPGGYPHSVTISFEAVWADMHMRALVLQQSGLKSTRLRESVDLARLFQYASFRFQELLSRLWYLDSLRRQCEAMGKESPWFSFAGLAIKDFHVDLGSLMDAVAPGVIRASGAVDLSSQKKLPGFADVNGDSQRSATFRLGIGEKLLGLIDSTAAWWRPIKGIRDILAHREHTKVVFGGPTDGVLFQLYDRGLMEPRVVDKRLLWEHGENVADFGLYSAAVMSELLCFLDDLGVALADCLGVKLGVGPRSFHVGDFTYLLGSMRRLLQSLEASGSQPAGT
jgi:hypothetical protein